MVAGFAKAVVTAVLLSLTAACTAPNGPTIQAEIATNIHEAACIGPAVSEDPWNIHALYDCEKRTLFIPYQLWTGATWNGEKDAPCMHRADKRFYVNGQQHATTPYAGKPAEAVRTIHIGCRWTGTEKFFTGDIDEILIPRHGHRLNRGLTRVLTVFQRHSNAPFFHA